MHAYKYRKYSELLDTAFLHLYVYIIYLRPY